MTNDQEARVLDGLTEALNYPAYVSPPPLPKRSAVPSGRILLWVGLLCLAVAGAFGAYVYAQVAKVDNLAERALKSWDKTEALMTSFGVDAPPSCLLARTDVARLRDYQEDKFGNLDKRIEALRAIHDHVRPCLAELERVTPSRMIR